VEPASGRARLNAAGTVHETDDQLRCRQLSVALRKHRLRRDGAWRDTVQYSMTDDEWPVARERVLRPRGDPGRPESH
jgi:hypothetical protein